MFSALRSRLSYANVVATLALLFAMSGGALAAKHYLINSTRQINPKVLKKLKGRGKTGATGATGLQGVAGPQGVQGPVGPEGPLLAALPSGRMLTGSFGNGENVPAGGSGAVQASISFPLPLTSSPLAEVIQTGGSPTAHCPGNVNAPSAARGYLCVYISEREHFNAGTAQTYSSTAAGEYTHGAVVFVSPSTSPPVYVSFGGTWAVTAP